MLEILQDAFQILIWVMGFILIGLVLLQGGAGDVGSAFGGGGQLDGTLGVGANRKLAKLTGWLSFLFMVMVLTLAIDNTTGFDDEGVAPLPTPTVSDPDAHSGALGPVPIDEAVIEADAHAADEVAAPAQAEQAEADPVAEEDDAVVSDEGTGVAFGDDDDEIADENDSED